MISSRFIDLANGDEVRLDSSPSSLGFQILGPDGVARGPEVPIVSTIATIDLGLQVDVSNAAALTHGFVVAYEDRNTVIGAGFGGETLNALVFDDGGILRGAFVLPAGAVPAGGAVAGIGTFALSDDAFAIVFDRQDGASLTHHLAVSGTGVDLTDFTLSGPIFHVDNSGGALTLGFADGSQIIVAGAGDDSLQAGAHGDTIRGGAGADVILGGAGHDDINGNSGNDTIAGGPGPETLRGGQGDDVISGGGGADFISGDRGDDTLTGGGGADTFHFSGDSGHDVINDFDAAGGDRILLDAGTPFTVVQSGSDVLIELGPNHDVFSAEVVLKGVQLSDLPPGFITLG